MKTTLFFVLLWVSQATPSVAQQICKDYDCALKQAIADFEHHNYQKALKGFTAAEAFDLTKAKEVDAWIAKIFDAVEEQKIKAEKADIETKKALDLVKIERKKAIDAGREATAVVDKIYFYKDNFGLAYDESFDFGAGGFGFIDKNRKTKIDFKYVEAAPFDRHTGYAKVKLKDTRTDKNVPYLIDIRGNEYKLATNLSELDTNILALDLSNSTTDTVIPALVFKQKQLKILLLSHSTLRYLPDSIGLLTNLVTLFLDNNALTRLPSGIGKLKNLETLDVGENLISSLPVELFYLSNLQNLDISRNRLTYLPVEIGKLTGLKNLDIGKNNLKGSLPIDVFKLTGLTELNVNDNQIEQLSVEIGQLTKLENLDISHNLLSTIPTQLGKLSRLQKLDLNTNQLTSLPVEIGKLKRLERLNLFKNKLYAVPVELFKLQTLRTLDLGYNKLTDVPAAIGKLIELRNLYLNNNTLSSLPIEINKLANLQTLFLNNNQFTRMSSLKVADFPSLQTLNMSGNKLTQVPIELGNLQSLQLLDLSENKLVSVPKELSNLANLRYLYLQHNQIKKISSDFCALKTLKAFDFSENSLDKTAECLNYFVDTLSKIEDVKVSRADSAYQEAKQLFAGGNYEETYKKVFLSTQLDTTDYYKYYDLSYYALFVGEYQTAIDAAKKTLLLNPNANSVETNLALGYLLNNEYDKAEAIYKKWKGKKFLETDLFMADKSFILDIKDLEVAGIECKDFGRVMKLLSKE